MSVIWFLWALYTAHVIDGIVYPPNGPNGTRKRNVPMDTFLKELKEATNNGIWPIIAFALVGLFLCAPIRFLGSLWWGWDWGLFLGLVSYGAFVLFDEPKGRSWLARTWNKGRAWISQRWQIFQDRQAEERRLSGTHTREELEGLGERAIEEMRGSDLLQPLIQHVRASLKYDVPNLLRERWQITAGITTVTDVLAQDDKRASPEDRERSIRILEKLEQKLVTTDQLLTRMRAQFIHLVPVAVEVRNGLSADHELAERTLGELRMLTEAIHASVAEDVPQLPALGTPSQPPPSSKEEETHTAPPSRTRVS